MTRVAYVDCVSGAAGDMLLGALIDAGAGAERMAEHVRSLGVDGLDLSVGRATRHGIVARRIDVVMPHSEHVHRRLADMRALIDAAGLPARAARRAHRTFQLLAEAEARMHDSEPELVHFHEVGGLDALADVCGVALALEELAIDRVECSPIPCSRGFADASHGRLPLPAPATLELLRGAPLVPLDIGIELVTPTAAAIFAATVERYGAMPAMTLENVGYGAGTRDLPQVPNIVRVLVGELTETASPASGGDVIVIETNLDDTPGELMPDAAARAFAAGALDVWTTPVQMKKGRPGVVLAALARPDDARAVAEAIVRETTALGVRMSRHERLELERRFHEVTVDGQLVRVKLGLLDGEVVNLAPEHDDCARAAKALGRPVKSVWAAALAAAEVRA
ncbi:MAG: pyridinium-3,5-bisthiocarboxylic acid mononucleotide nickel chelatase [Gaiellales bacterium]|nr:pyridinium-3,5-bisthiocarboxylic acid mononucleotide nickel chelatase [Gaiellales bacterium]